MLGRWLMGLVIIVLAVLMPLRYFAMEKTFTVDSMIESEVDETVDRMIRDGRITLDDIARLEAISGAGGAGYEVSLTRGERIELTDGPERYQYVIVTPETNAELLLSEGVVRLERGDTFTLRLTHQKESMLERLADTLIRGSYYREEYVGGGMYLG